MDSAKLQEIMETMYNEDGFCLLPIDSYQVITGERIHHTTGKKELVTCHWYIDHSRSDGLLWGIVDGITGHELWYVETIRNALEPDRIFAACVDEPGKHDSLTFYGIDVLNIVNNIWSEQYK